MSIHPARQSHLTVGAQRLEVMFKDGTAITLHPLVDAGDTPDTYLRALRLPSSMTIVVDVRSLVPQIGEDLASAQQKDRNGIVFFSLRHHFSTAELCVRQICDHGRALVEHLEAA